MPLINDIFLFYLFVHSLRQNTQKSSIAIVLVNFIEGHECITVTETSNDFI